MNIIDVNSDMNIVNKKYFCNNAVLIRLVLQCAAAHQYHYTTLSKLKCRSTEVPKFYLLTTIFITEENLPAVRRKKYTPEGRSAALKEISCSPAGISPLRSVATSLPRRS